MKRAAQILIFVINTVISPNTLSGQDIQPEMKRSKVSSKMNETVMTPKTRLSALLHELMTYQSEESIRQYGRLHTGMDGKLYGTSDAELNELLTAFLMMKEQMLVESKGELAAIYSELEIYAAK